MRLLFLIVCFFALMLDAQGQVTLYGTVTDENRQPVEAANVTIPYTNIGTITNSQGYFELKVPADKPVNIYISFLGYLTIDTVLTIINKPRVEADFVLKVDVTEIREVWISTQVNKGSNLTRIEIKDFGVLPNATGSIETLLKTMPGVSSNNELSSQYSVRGGNFDENLVYVNGIEIYRPFLVRSGQQEGLSFINPDMIRSIDFSAGGFEAKYGDKMSSALDITYRTPSKNTGSVSASLLGGSAHIEGVAFKDKFRHISGFRYKTTQYLLKTLEVTGTYKPSFIDFQSLLTYDATSKLQFSFLGNYSANKYLLQPESRNSKIGTFNNPLGLYVKFEGTEIDNFNSLTGAFSTSYNLNKKSSINFTVSTFCTVEAETYDLLGYYNINEIDKSAGSDSYGDSIGSLGGGTFLNHARNYLDAQFFNFSINGIHENNENSLEWGISAQLNDIKDELVEWEMIDSAGYSIPYYGSRVSVLNYLEVENHVISKRYNVYLQKKNKINADNGEWYLTYGIRSNHWNYNKQTTVSPRVSVAYIPTWNRSLSFFTSFGYYYQPPLYKEFRDENGELNKNIISQKSVHYIVGTDYLFSAWDRPFKFSTEIYYKKLDNLIPYKIDNIRIQYMGRNASVGYAAGIEFKVSGEFVQDAQSWASLSFLTTKEDIIGDFYIHDNIKHYPGYIRRPTDQLINFATFFQDYFPNNPDYKFHLAFFFGSRLPAVFPSQNRYDLIYKMPAYKRIDVGLSKSLDRLTFGGFLNSVWLNIEVLNLFGFENVSSYSWIKTVSMIDGVFSQVAVDNTLTGRMLNVKISVKF